MIWGFEGDGQLYCGEKKSRFYKFIRVCMNIIGTTATL